MCELVLLFVLRTCRAIHCNQGHSHGQYFLRFCHQIPSRHPADLSRVFFISMQQCGTHGRNGIFSKILAQLQLNFATTLPYTTSSTRRSKRRPPDSTCMPRV